ncbi:hypothetical protein CA267_014750 [Alteromonas pelagimontana]|uniref:CAP-Gly protein n=1 Tax=Alteromonas pelagimontana TaxID=1858656 RepID=A0A6M4MFS1_9ALTE|nr:hypothetical protein [Alteromonas pelagimontana]QJR81923.1 hypothetical protein CA267_014750 [Alteromonas pelagimontana]
MERETLGTTATAAATFNEGHRVSWGAIFAGVTLMVALSWLLLLLGSAIGVGIADATDLSAMGDGLGIGSIIWILISTIVATFAGGLLAAKIAGILDDRIGALHGLTVWSVGTLLMVVLGASGIGGAMNSIGNALGTVNKASASVASTGSGEQSLIPDSVKTSIAAIIKRQASSVISETSSGENGPSQGEVQSAIDSLNAEDAGAISSALISGDTEKARNELTQRTELSDDEINSIIEGAKEQADSWSESDDAQQAQNWLSQQVEDVQRSVSQSVSNMAGGEVSSQEVSQTLEELDSETMISAGQYLIMGEPDRAKDVLAVNTNLSESEVEAIVDGAEKEAKELISKAKAELNEASETVGTYTQAILWSAFIAAALGMVAGLVGGHMGAGAVRRVYPARR